MHTVTHDYVNTLERDSIAFVDSLDNDPTLGRIIRGDASREEYAAFLAATYHYVRWSGPLLAATAEGLRLTGRCPWLIAIMDTKTAEESPHYAWALADLKKCGGDVESVKASAAPIAVDTYVEWSLMMAQEGSPAFLGAAYTLEFISMHRASVAAANLRARKAIPNIERAVLFLEGHGDADIGHIQALSDVLRTIEDPRDQDAILLSAAVMRTVFPRFFQPGATAARRSAGVPSKRQRLHGGDAAPAQ